MILTYWAVEAARSFGRSTCAVMGWLIAGCVVAGIIVIALRGGSGVVCASAVRRARPTPPLTALLTDVGILELTATRRRREGIPADPGGRRRMMRSGSKRSRRRASRASTAQGWAPCRPRRCAKATGRRPSGAGRRPSRGRLHPGRRGRRGGARRPARRRSRRPARRASDGAARRGDRLGRPPRLPGAHAEHVRRFRVERAGL